MRFEADDDKFVFLNFSFLSTASCFLVTSGVSVGSNMWWLELILYRDQSWLVSED